jgi:ketosteroid isomerase-like protein
MAAQPAVTVATLRARGHAITTLREPRVALETDALHSEIRALEDAWTQALVDRDVERIRSFMTDDFSITTAGWLDTPADRETWLGHGLDGFRLEWFAYDDVRVRRYGDNVVVAQSRCRQRGTDLASGGPWAMVFRYTDVWVRDGDGAWRIDVRQATGRPWTEADDS